MDHILIGSYLRYDNAKKWIAEYNGTDFQVTIDDFTDIYLHPENYSYVPLTKEYLTQLGFTERKQSYFKIYNGIDCMIVNIEDKQFYSNIGHIPLKYVHDLQHLYYFYTKEILSKENKHISQSNV